MRTVRNQGGLLLLGGVTGPGGSGLGGVCLLWGCVSGNGGAWSWGVSHALRQNPPVDRQTPVKT